ncbi:MAG: hypothetical protein DRI48_06020 [Chloroflexi bacterium]|nr:MAG: hypothetical protein DRI48_06020 [Chloroflexota bacterium]
MIYIIAFFAILSGIAALSVIFRAVRIFVEYLRLRHEYEQARIEGNPTRAFSAWMRYQQWRTR